MNNNRLLSLGLGLLLLVLWILSLRRHSSALPLVAIANYGPHASLTATIEGIQQELARQGWIDQKTIRYAISDVGFDAALIPQMVTQLKQLNPTVMVVMTTPVAQFAKVAIKHCPLVYSAITDPVTAGLIKTPEQADGSMTGSSERQDLHQLLAFAQQLLPHAKRVGVLYATAESNDQALVRLLQEAAAQQGLSVLALPVNHAREVPLRMQQFRGQVDFIYVGTSGPIQPSLPVIALQSQKMGIPVFNVDESAVKQGLVLASFGVNYTTVGVNTGQLVAALLQGADPAQLPPRYPTAADHQGFISRQQAAAWGITLPPPQPYLTLVE
jgi:putative ABC transport system substrate-binding protein